MKKIYLMILVVLSLVACSKTTRTNVIDILLDNGFIRNKAYFYERSEDSYVLRIGYQSAYQGYYESLHNYFGPGPVALVDIGNDVSFNYHLNEDGMLYTIDCYKSNAIVSTQLMYSFKNNELIVGDNYCDYSSDNDEEYIDQFKLRKDIILEKLKELDLDKKKLNLLK